MIASSGIFIKEIGLAMKICVGKELAAKIAIITCNDRSRINSHDKTWLLDPIRESYKIQDTNKVVLS